MREDGVAGSIEVLPMRGCAASSWKFPANERGGCSRLRRYLANENE